MASFYLGADCTLKSARPKVCTWYSGSKSQGSDDASQEEQVRCHRTDRDENTPLLQAAYDSGEELFLGTCDSRGVELEKFYKEDHTFYKVIVDDFNAKIGPQRSQGEFHIGTAVWRGKSKVKDCLKASLPTIDLGIPRWQFHNEIDHTIFNRKYCQTGVSVVPKIGPQPLHLRFSHQGEKAVKIKNGSPRTTINWDLYTSFADLWEDTDTVENIDKE
ncbi:unnamed protein product [Heligmosomoides polygyrus]|uniref:Ricin B-type lectin domain-containing protein n=1 Tax=Heligmosomoides polygyrus TaxID=6339 RepID=A0A183GT49_HELPZ|nr:unnamed protein product [Heligmosomoides polygyrus]